MLQSALKDFTSASHEPLKPPSPVKPPTDASPNTLFRSKNSWRVKSSQCVESNHVPAIIAIGRRLATRLHKVLDTRLNQRSWTDERSMLLLENLTSPTFRSRTSLRRCILL